MMRDELEESRRNVIAAMSALVKRAQEAGAVRADLAGQDLGILAHSVAASAELPFPGVRNDIWKRYLGVILDGLRPDGATKLRPGPPPKRAFETPGDSLSAIPVGGRAADLLLQRAAVVRVRHVVAARLAAQARAGRQTGRDVDAAHLREQQPRRHVGRVRDRDL